MGTKRDMTFCEKKQRVDNVRWRQSVEAARKLLFQRGASLNSQCIKNLLNHKSLVPTRVRALKDNVTIAN